MSRAVVVLTVLTALIAAPPATAAGKASLIDVEDEVMCVSCEIPLNIAESAQADQQRDFIRAQIDAGKSKEQIKTALVAEYGREVLALPDSEGFGLTAYLVPLALVALLAGGLALLLPRWRRRAPAALAETGEAPELSKAEASRLDEELARYER